MISRTNVKINLGLSVLRKRSDGYHDIETLFVPSLRFGDTLEIITGDDYSHTSAALFARYDPAFIAQGISADGKLMITIARTEGVDWNPLDDLCAKAYSLLAKDFPLPPIKIFLEKIAPVGAGLGGGSADGAFTLRMLNELCRLGLSDSALCEYAASLGSDCPFFIFNRPMIGSGRGEVLESYELNLDALGLEMQLIVPEGVSVSTAEAYDGIVPRESATGADSGSACGSGSGSACPQPSLREELLSVQTPLREGMLCDQTPLREALAQPVEKWKDLLVNDFEKTVFAKHPELAAIKQSLYDSGALYASMSGSGSALFALYKKA